MKSILICVFSLILASAQAQANRAVFKEIAEIASVGNGGAEVKTYDKSLKKIDLQAQGKAELEKDYWEGCGPWKNITSRREAIKHIEWLEGMAGEKAVPAKLKALYEKDEIVAVVGAISNNEVECSLSWFLIYGTDGSKLELLYNMGD